MGKGSAPRAKGSARAFGGGRQRGAGKTGLGEDLEALAGRYDWLSAGIGALAVTTFCVARGQDPGEALRVTVCATVLAVVLNELLKDAVSR